MAGPESVRVIRSHRVKKIGRVYFVEVSGGRCFEGRDAPAFIGWIFNMDVESIDKPEEVHINARET